jgi:beta-lactamase regulating signal transducer with metallopeptidase domain
MNMPLWFSNLLYWSVQVALLSIAAALLPRLFQLRQPRVLLVYWRSIIALSLLLPFLQPWHRLQSIPVTMISEGFSAATLATPSPTQVSRWQIPNPQAFVYTVAFIILTGIAVRLGVLVLGVLKLRQLRRISLPISERSDFGALLETIRDQINATADFRLSADVESPVTFGLRPPVILLPERMTSMEPRFQTAIACHELLHVRRHDWAYHLAEELLRSTFWFHPAIAWLISRVRLAREQLVDLEVVRLTQAQRPYVQALLEFTNAHVSTASIPAPPFLAECQLVERVALLLKEVRMSRRKLISSLVAISCCVVAVVIVAAFTFPLKGAPRLTQSAPPSGVSGGISGDGPSGGISGGIAGGISGGIAGRVNGEAAKRQQTNEPDVDYSTIWTATVKRGPMLLQVRGVGTLVRADNSTNFIARVMLPQAMVRLVQPNQNASVDTREGIVKGRVSGISAEIANGMGSVDIALAPTPEVGFTPGHQIDSTIDIEKLDNILQVGRPASVPANSTDSVSGSVFKIVDDGREAERVVVKFGRSSVNTIEVLDGLKERDRIIISDMSSTDNAYRIHFTDQMHLIKH